MAFEEKNAWIQAAVTASAYTVYLIVVLGRSSGVPLAETPYAGVLLWSIGGAIAAAILLHVASAIIAPRDADRKDQRDREIGRFGEYVGQSLVVVGGIAALVLALLELPHFWIANALYLAFVLSSLLASTAKIAAYRWGFQAP